MRIGIKYCGGCNPVYNRGRQVKRLQEQYPEHVFDFAAGDMKECEIGLVVCGNHADLVLNCECKGGDRNDDHECHRDQEHLVVFAHVSEPCGNG